jgi:phage/plasmid-associated DNA primase
VTKALQGITGVAMCFAIKYMNPDLLAGKNGNTTVTSFLKDVFGNDDREVTEYLQRFLGYGTTHHTNEQCCDAFDSSGSNGKSSLAVVLEKGNRRGITHQFVYAS